MSRREKSPDGENAYGGADIYLRHGVHYILKSFVSLSEALAKP